MDEQMNKKDDDMLDLLLERCVSVILCMQNEKKVTEDLCERVCCHPNISKEEAWSWERKFSERIRETQIVRRAYEIFMAELEELSEYTVEIGSSLEPDIWQILQEMHSEILETYSSLADKWSGFTNEVMIELMILEKHFP